MRAKAFKKNLILILAGLLFLSPACKETDSNEEFKQILPIVLAGLYLNSFTFCLPPTDEAGAAVSNQVNLLAHVETRASGPIRARDVWGFTDAVGGEYAVLSHTEGTLIYDVTNPAAPTTAADIPGARSMHRDVKTLSVNTTPGSFQAYAYVVNESEGGMDIINLANVPASASALPAFTGFQTAHNIFIHETASPPILYVVGSPNAEGGILAYSLADPANPALLGSWAGKYVHDVYVSSNWADPAYNGREIALAFARDTVEILDVSDKSNITVLSSLTYPQVGYVHSGWVGSNGRYLYIHDELDEMLRRTNTRTIVADLIDLANPSIVATWTSSGRDMDHNGVTNGSFHYISHYTAGLTVLDVSDPLNPTRAGWYDTFNAATEPPSCGFDGSWGVYPLLPSRNILLSDINKGLYIMDFLGD